MEKMEVTWNVTLKVWWSFFWRAAVFGAIAGALAGGVVGFFLGLTGNTDQIPMYSGAAGYLVSIPITIWVMKIILEKRFGNFSLAIVREQDA